MTRYRVTIEVDTNAPRAIVNASAAETADELQELLAKYLPATNRTEVVYVSTEVVLPPRRQTIYGTQEEKA